MQTRTNFESSNGEFQKKIISKIISQTDEYYFYQKARKKYIYI